MAKKTSSRAPKSKSADAPVPVERVQLGVRLEKRMVKVLKAVAEYGDLTLGELLEDIILHSFEGGSTFGTDDLKIVNEFKRVYGMDYDVHDNYRFAENS